MNENEQTGISIEQELLGGKDNIVILVYIEIIFRQVLCIGFRLQ